MGDNWELKLSDYLDGGLSTAECREVEAHLAACNECRVTLEELRAVVSRAAALDERAPENDLWSGIVRRIAAAGAAESDVVGIQERRAARRRISVSLPQLVAAGIVLVMLSAGTTWLLQSGRSEPTPQSAAGPDRSAAVQAVRAGFDLTGYDAVVADLEQALDEARDRLEPNTVRVLEQSLATIDRAILDAYDALEQDPTNSYLSSHLAATMKRKVELLQRVVTIANAAS